MCMYKNLHNTILWLHMHIAMWQINRECIVLNFSRWNINVIICFGVGGRGMFSSRFSCSHAFVPNVKPFCIHHNTQTSHYQSTSDIHCWGGCVCEREKKKGFQISPQKIFRKYR